MDIDFWLKTLEVSAAVLTLLGCWLNTKGISLGWVAEGIAAIEASVIYYFEGLYGQASLQWFFVLSGIYGFFQWQGHRPKDELLISNTPYPQAIMYSVLALVGYALLQYYFIPIYNSKAEPLDSLTTSLSLVGTLMMARRKYEAWLVWMLTNLLLVILMITTELWLFAGQYFVLLAISVEGYRNWIKIYKKQLEGV